MLQNVVALVLPDVPPFELGVLCEVFGVDRSDMGVEPFDFDVCAPVPGPVRTPMGFSIDIEHGLERVAQADLVAIPAYSRRHDPLDAPVAEALRSTVARGGRVLSVCSGAFALAAAGLLDGRRCTTHWMYTDELAAAYPAAEVDPAVLYVDAGPVITSAGSAAGIDACLHVVRQARGAAVAATIARRMVVPPHRDGGQAQYIETPIPIHPADTLEPLLTWMAAHVDEDLMVEDLARRAHMSPRSFARRFRAETGTTPMHWLTGQRILLAQRLLEDSDEPLDRVASRVGFGTASVLRHHFTRWRGTTPQAYRRTFRRTSA